MSNTTVHNTNVDMIRNNVFDLINELENTNYVYTKTPYDPVFESLKNKYNYLHKTSKTLFVFITQETNKKNFSKEIFYRKIDEILNLVLKIQKSELTQNEASEKVGVMLANEYIPANLLKKEE